MLKSLRPLVLIGAVLVLGSLASAGPLLTTPVQYAFGPGAPTFDQSVAVAQFPLVQYLDSVHVLLLSQLTLNGGGLSYLTCSGGTIGSDTCTGSYTIQATVTLSLSGSGLSLAQVVPANTINFNLLSGQTLYLPSATYTAHIPTGTYTNMDPTTGEITYNASDPNWLAIKSAFGGSGTTTLNVHAEDSSTLSQSGTNGAKIKNFNADLTADGYAQIAYDYSVPEPTTFLMIGTALLGLGWFGQSKMRKR